MKSLIDPHGRRVRKLRLSLTDRCNLRCHYCMPVDTQFMDPKKYLTPDEIEEIVRDLVEYGLEEVRLTGGEPLMRKSFAEIVSRLSRVGLKKLALTTNGIFLDQHFDVLKANGVLHLNVSLDSLDAENFQRITHGDHFRKVIANIERAVREGFHVKVNVVAMRGVNDHELLDFVSFSEKHQVEVRFLELMRIGYACGTQASQYVSATEMMERLKARHELKPVMQAADSTSFNFLTDTGAQIGFIASESQAFCGQCSRWRLSADGVLRACLLKDDGRAIRGKTLEERAELYGVLLGLKPAMRPLEVSHPMNLIGG